VYIECHNYETKKLSIFRTDSVIPRAVIPVKTKFGYRREVFLLDTGADITMLPSSARELFDGPFEECSQDLRISKRGEKESKYKQEIYEISWKKNKRERR
jgi:hypothetical protein